MEPSPNSGQYQHQDLSSPSHLPHLPTNSSPPSQDQLRSPSSQNPQYRQTSSQNYNNSFSPTPTPDQSRQGHQSQRPLPRQRPSTSTSSNMPGSRSFSIRSFRSRNNSEVRPAINVAPESEEELRAQRLQSKGDPTLAINEAEPCDVALATSDVRATPLRDMIHKDQYGNPIVEPDKSNPTRPRSERPLETIRRFEAAIDSGYSRKSIIRGDTESVANFNRRNSYYSSFGRTPFDPETYYHHRPVSFRPGHTAFDLGGRSGVYDEEFGYYGIPANAMTRQNRPSRVFSEPSNNYSYAHYGPVYRHSHQDRSYETVTSAAGSGGSEAVGYQTDPTSSESSSIDRRSPSRRMQHKHEFFGPPSNPPRMMHSSPYRRLTPEIIGGVRGPGMEQMQSPLPSRRPSPLKADRSPPPLVAPAPTRPTQVIRKEPSPPLQKRHASTQAAPAPLEKRKSWLARKLSRS